MTAIDRKSKGKTEPIHIKDIIPGVLRDIHERQFKNEIKSDEKRPHAHIPTQR